MLPRTSIDLPLDIRSLRPDSAAASEHLDLFAELAQQQMRTVVVRIQVQVDLVGLVYSVDCLLDIPETIIAVLVPVIPTD